jgi:hypothetical protein
MPNFGSSNSAESTRNHFSDIIKQITNAKYNSTELEDGLEEIYRKIQKKN